MFVQPPKLAGEVVKLYVKEGSQVQKGEILAQIDHSTLDLQLEQAKAGEELADAQLALLLQGARKEDILQAEKAAQQAEDYCRKSQPLSKTRHARGCRSDRPSH